MCGGWKREEKIQVCGSTLIMEDKGMECVWGKWRQETYEGFICSREFERLDRDTYIAHMLVPAQGRSRAG